MAKTYSGYALTAERKLRWESLRHAVDLVHEHAPDDLLDLVQERLDDYRRCMSATDIGGRTWIIEGED